MDSGSYFGRWVQYCLAPDCQVRTEMIVSNLLDTSREDVVSNNEVEKLCIPHRMHSHAILLLKDFL